MLLLVIIDIKKGLEMIQPSVFAMSYELKAISCCLLLIQWRHVP
jgi:hypothetical protein